MDQCCIRYAAVTDTYDYIPHTCPLVVEPGINCLIGSKKPATVNIYNHRQVICTIQRTIDIQQVFWRTVGYIRNIGEN